MAASLRRSRPSPFAGRGLGVLLFGTLILITSYAKAVERDRQVPVVAADRPLRRPRRRPRRSRRISRPRPASPSRSTWSAASAGCWSRVALLPFIASWVGINPRPSVAGDALLHAASDHGRGDAQRRASRARPVRPHQLAEHGDPDRPRDPRRHAAFVADAPFPVYVAHLVSSPTSAAISTPGSSAGASSSATACSKGITADAQPDSLPGAWRFAIDVNLATSVQAVWGPIARLVVGGLLGPAGAALFRVASTLADSAQKPADLLGKAFYPEVVRMDLTSKKPWKLMLRGTGAGQRRSRRWQSC